MPAAGVLAGISEVEEELAKEVRLMMAEIKAECKKIAGVKNIKNPERKAFFIKTDPIHYIILF